MARTRQERALETIFVVAAVAALATACGAFEDSAPTDLSDAEPTTDGGTPTGDAGADPCAVSAIGCDDASTGQTKIRKVQASTPMTQVGGDIRLDFSTPTTPGTLLVATLAVTSTNGFAAPSPWLMGPVGGSAANGFGVVAYYPANPGGVTRVTFAMGNAVSVGQLSEWAGVAPSAPLDATATGSGTGTLTLSTASPTTAADELGIAVFSHYARQPTYTPSHGWDSLGERGANAGGDISYVANYHLGLPVGPVTFSQTSSVSDKWAGALATFRPQ
jgi:hypothetical protein